MSDHAPNILLIHTDQQRTDSLSCYGSTFTATPNIDRLARQGVRLTRAYCTNPVCTPSRVSIFTGRQVSRHGAWNVGVFTPPDTIMLTHRLAWAGYQTHAVGKLHFEPFGDDRSREALGNQRQRRPGVDAFDGGPYFGFQSVELAPGHTTFGINGHYGQWVAERSAGRSLEDLGACRSRAAFDFGGNALDWNLPTELHNSVWTAQRTIEFLNAHDRSRPFFLSVGFQDPHHPHVVPRDLPESLRVDPASVPLPDWTDGELADKPAHFDAARRGDVNSDEHRGQFWMAGQFTGADFRGVTEHDAREGRAYYYTMARLIDREVGRVLDTLDRLGLADNTIVVFTTDHGELLGDHGLWMKGPFHYEPLIRVPLIVRWPAGLPAGRVYDHVLSHTDLVPTLLAATGRPNPGDLDGIDALAALRDDRPCREHALVECIDDPGVIRCKTLVTRDHKLTWYARSDAGEFYDLAADPREKINRWNDPAAAPAKAAMLTRLMRMLETLELPLRAGRPCYA